MKASETSTGALVGLVFRCDQQVSLYLPVSAFRAASTSAYVSPYHNSEYGGQLRSESPSFPRNRGARSRSV